MYHECEGGIKKSVPRIAVGHHKACRVTTNGDGEGRIFFYPILTQIILYIFFHAYHLFCIFLKLPEVSDYAAMRHNMMTSL